MDRIPIYIKETGQETTAKDNTLVHKECKPYDFWFGSGN